MVQGKKDVVAVQQQQAVQVAMQEAGEGEPVVGRFLAAAFGLGQQDVVPPLERGVSLARLVGGQQPDFAERVHQRAGLAQGTQLGRAVDLLEEALEEFIVGAGNAQRLLEAGDFRLHLLGQRGEFADGMDGVLAGVLELLAGGAEFLEPAAQFEPVARVPVLGLLRLQGRLDARQQVRRGGFGHDGFQVQRFGQPLAVQGGQFGFDAGLDGFGLAPLPLLQLPFERRFLVRQHVELLLELADFLGQPVLFGPGGGGELLAVAGARGAFLVQLRL